MEHSICEDPSDESIGNNDNVGLHGDLPVSLCRRMVLTALGDKGSLWGEAAKWVFTMSSEANSGRRGTLCHEEKWKCTMAIRWLWKQTGGET